MVSKLVRTVAAVTVLVSGVTLWTRPAAAQATEKQLKGRGPAAPAPAAIIGDADANRTRDELTTILERYPPSVGRILKLDPSLINPEYLATYPNYVAFLWSFFAARDLASAGKPLSPLMEAGGTKDAAELVKDFLGRGTGTKAFEKYLAEPY